MTTVAEALAAAPTAAPPLTEATPPDASPPAVETSVADAPAAAR
jgi:hypothetical protein